MGSLASSLWLDFKSDFIKKNQQSKICKPWLQSIKISKIDKSNQGFNIILQVPSLLHKNWVEDHILKDLASNMYEKLKNKCSVDIEITPPLPLSNVQKKEERSSKPRNFFRPEYTFENFIVGKHNELAHGAAFSISQSIKAPSYNPLFIFGPSGLGKTHLLNAVGHSALNQNSNLRIIYVSAERFLNEYVTALKQRELGIFRSKYRKKCDLLLMDDIQMVTKGPSIQEEFFHTFNDLFEKKIPVVVCCDKPPSQIPGLQERIQTRLEGGLVVDISYLELETRLAILKYKADKKSLKLSEESSLLIAQKCSRSVRELEGVLNKIKMLSELRESSPSEKMVKNILKSLGENELTTQTIQSQVADKFGISIKELCSPSRTKNIVTARHVAIFLVKKNLGRSLSEIGRSFGDRDHTTVLNSLKKVEKLRVKNTDFKTALEDLQKKIHTYKKGGVAGF